MPLSKGDKVLGQIRRGNKLILLVKDKSGKIKSDVRKTCKCPKDPKKPCKCKK
jgi:hypothetical protein